MGNKGSAPAAESASLGSGGTADVLASKCLGQAASIDIAYIFTKFEQEEAYLVTLLQAELRAWVKKEFAEYKKRSQERPQNDELEYMNGQMMGIERDIQGFLKAVESKAIKERKRIKAKLQGTHRFILSHVVDVFKLN